MTLLGIDFTSIIWSSDRKACSRRVHYLIEKYSLKQLREVLHKIESDEKKEKRAE
jgi:hypothetical protein